MHNRIVAAEECDATGDDKCYKARFINFFTKKFKKIERIIYFTVYYL